MEGKPSIEARWSNLGVWFVTPPAPEVADPEAVLLDTARRLPENARVFQAAATWLVFYAALVARHRLRALCHAQLTAVEKARMGFLIDTAVELGATRDLRIVTHGFDPVEPPRPLFDVDRSNAVFARIAESTSSDLARSWGFWAPSVTLKPQIIRPSSWLIGRHPHLRDRLARQGDLRSSVIQVLRNAPEHRVVSLSELARLTNATRAAVRDAVNKLEREGLVKVGSGTSRRERPIELLDAA